MSSRKSLLPLIIFCIVSVLLLSIWANSSQDLCVQHVLDNGDIVLELDTDSHIDDSLEQAALIARAPTLTLLTHDARYPLESALHIASLSFLPPDRPPESV